MGFAGVSAVKNLPAVQETQVQSLGQEDPQEEGVAAHSSILPWRIPMDRGAWGPWGCKQSDTTERLSTAHVSMSGFVPSCWAVVLHGEVIWLPSSSQGIF